MKQSLNNNFKVLLIYSSFEDKWRSPTINTNGHYPLGLAYIHAFLEKHHHIARTLYLNDYPFQLCFSIVKKTIKKFKPDIIGLNILTNNRVSSYKIIEYIHKTYPKIRILTGGIHASVMSEQIVATYPYVINVRGEGEITTIKLLDKFRKNQPYHHVKGITYYLKGKVITTKSRALIKNLDTLPFPKHEIFFESNNRTIASILTARGCPFHCSFCVLDSISRRMYRRRSIESVIEEIKYLKHKYPQLETIWIHDDQFFLDNQRVIQFCDEVIKNNIKIKFICSGRYKPVSKEMVEALEKAGFVQVMFGLESGSQKVLDQCHKMITQEDVIRTLTLFKKSKIFVVTFLIVGLYGETEKTIKEGYTFVQKIQKIKYLYFGDISVLTIYPGTEIYDIAKSAKIINDTYWLSNKPTPLFTVEHSEAELIHYKNVMLNHISLPRYFTPRGFIGQFFMTSNIIKFLLSSLPQIPMVLLLMMQRYHPKLYGRLRQVKLFQKIIQGT